MIIFKKQDIEDSIQFLFTSGYHRMAKELMTAYPTPNVYFHERIAWTFALEGILSHLWVQPDIKNHYFLMYVIGERTSQPLYKCYHFGNRGELIRSTKYYANPCLAWLRSLISESL